MLEVFDQLFFSVDFATATVRLSVALIFASIGELFAERSGVVNIGLEGMMLIGAFMGVVGSFLGGSAWWGLPMAILGGALAALLLAHVSITLAGDQIVCGVALNIAILGLTTFLSRTLWGVGKSPEVAQFKAIHIAGLSDLPVIGELFFRYSPLTYIAFLCLPLTAWVLLRTRWGLSISAVGEHPRAADSVGISVFRTRYLTVILSGMFDDFPDFPLIVSHLGANLHYMCERIGNASHLGSAKAGVMEYLRRFYYDTAGPVPAAAVGCALQMFSSEKILFGSDYPFGPGHGEAFIRKGIACIEDQACGDEEKEAMFSGNARGILGL